jgi:hypothetical protein
MLRKERNVRPQLGATSYLHLHRTISGFDVPTPGWFRPDRRRELSIRRILLGCILRQESLYLGPLGEAQTVGRHNAHVLWMPSDWQDQVRTRHCQRGLRLSTDPLLVFGRRACLDSFPLHPDLPTRNAKT